MRRLLVTGSLAYDYILDYPGLLQNSLESFCGQESDAVLRFQTPHLARYFGGCGGNVAYTLGILGENPRLVSIAGRDTEDYLAHLARAGVDCSFVRHVPDENTALCLIMNDQAQNRIVFFHNGVVDRATELSVKDAIQPDTVGCIITPDDVPGMVKFAQECRELGLPYYFDFGSQVTWLSGEQLRDGLTGARAAFCNEYEFSMFEKKTGWTLNDLLQRVPVMLITRGAEGCDLYLKGESPVHLPACPLRPGHAIDPSGAGDAFRAALGFARVREWPWRVSVQLASTAAAFALEARGTQGHSFTRESLLERCQQYYGPLDSALLAQL